MAVTRLGTDRPQGVIVNLHQNVEYMPNLSPVVPALLKASRLWSLGLSREVLPTEHLEIQGWCLQGPMQAQQAVKDALEKQSPAVLRRMAGNGFHLASVGTALLLGLAVMVPIVE
eukprot:2202118-Amphidinium_carterae.1